MERYTYFEAPMQVKFWEPEANDYMGGIAYKDEVICGGCGGVISITDINCNAPKDVVPLIVYDDWIDIQADIVGE